MFLAAFYGLPLSGAAGCRLSETEALAIFLKHTGRTKYDPPLRGYGEGVAIVGRQADKDRIAGTVQDYEATISGRSASTNAAILTVQML